MKLSFTFGILIIVLSLQSCSFDVGVKDDRIPGAVYTSEGLDSDPVIMTVDGKKSKSNVFTFGNEVKFTFNNVEGLKRLKGLAYPGMSMYINDENDSTIYRIDDLQMNVSNGTDLHPLVLDAKFKAALPHLDNEKYTINLRIWDKKRAGGKITFRLPFQIKPSEVLDIKSKDLDYSNIYLWDQTEKKVILDKTVNVKNEFILFIEGLEGFDLIDESAFPGLELTLLDKNGKKMLYEENMFGQIAVDGVNENSLRDESLPVTISFPHAMVKSTGTLKARIFDTKNPEKSILVEGKLRLE